MFFPHPPHFLPSQGQRARTMAVAAFILVPIAMGLLALALGQDANWDLRNYHFYNAHAFLNDRYAKDLLPSQTPYFYNPLMDIPFYLMATHMPAKAVGFALGFVQGLNFLLIFALAHAALIVPNPRHKTILCIALGVLGLMGGGGIAQIGTTFGDNVTSLGALLSAAMIVRHGERLFARPPAKAFAVAFAFGIPAGLVMGMKLPSVVYAVGLCAGLFFSGKGWSRRFLLSFAFGLGVLAGCVVTMGYWAAFLQIHFGSPFFPYFNNIFHSPLAPPESARDVQYVPGSIRDFLLMPFIFAQSPFRVGEIPWRDWRIPILYGLLPLAVVLRLFFGRNRAAADALSRPFATRYLLLSFTFAYLVWLKMFAIYRYAVTIEMVAPLLIVFAIGMLPLKISTRGLLAAFALTIAAASVQPGNWHRRQAWLDRFVEVRIPDLGDTSNLMILMAGTEPYSHVVPAFPPEIAFVRIQSNFSSPEENKGINDLLRARIEAHRAAGGRFMILIPSWQLKGAQEATAYFGLAVQPGKCKTVTDRLFDDNPLSLCPVVSRK